MDVQDDLGDKDSIKIIQFPALDHCSFQVSKGDLFSSNEECICGLEELYNLDGILYLGILEFFEVSGDLRRRREQ